MISWIFDKIEQAVSPQKEKPMAIPLKQTSKQEIQQLQIEKQLLQQYQQANLTAQYNKVVTAGTLGAATQGGYITSTGTTTGLATTTIYNGPLSVGNGQYNAYVNQSPPSIPAPTRIMVTCQFCDANGSSWALTIDQAYLPLLSQISQQHHAITMLYPAPNFPTSPAPRMIEGDFSMDEMEKAERLIEELQGAPQDH